MELTLSDICSRIGGELIGDGETRINGISPPENAQAGHLTFAADKAHLTQALNSKASAVLVPAEAAPISGRPGIRTTDTKLAFAKLLELFYPEPLPAKGIHPTAVLGAEVRLGDDVSVGAHAVIEDGVSIGRGTRIGAGAYIGHASALGEDCALYPNVTVYRRTRLMHRVVIHSGSVIGGDGFGYIFSDGAYRKIPQTGDVCIESDVEIGCNVCVDRATMGTTVIREGSKIDNLVQIAHNNDIGRHVAIAGQTGLAGSVKVGDYTRFGGKCCVSDHVTVGQGVNAGIGTLIIQSVVDGATVWGVPARPSNEAKRQVVSLTRVPELLKQRSELEQRLKAQEERLTQLERRLQTEHRTERSRPQRYSAL